MESKEYRFQRRMLDYGMGSIIAATVESPFHLPQVDAILYDRIVSYIAYMIRYSRRQRETVEEFRTRRLQQMHSNTRTYAPHVDQLL